MMRLIGTIVLSFLISGIGTDAQADGSWCVFYDGSTYNCGLHSFEQCYATANGAGGWCRPNFFQGYGSARRPPPKGTGDRRQ
jgi:Protein of unknown function (DUF3551)